VGQDHAKRRLISRDCIVSESEALNRAQSAFDEAYGICSASQLHQSSTARALAEADAMLAGAQVSYASDDYVRAVELNRAGVQRCVANLGECHLKSATGLHKLGRAYEMSVFHSRPPLSPESETETLQEAEGCYRRVIATRAKLLGWGHNDTVMAARDLIDVLEALLNKLPAKRVAFSAEVAALRESMHDAVVAARQPVPRDGGDLLEVASDVLGTEDSVSEDDWETVSSGEGGEETL